jgi:hypothetical protein
VCIYIHSEREREKVFTKEVNTFGKSECAKKVNMDNWQMMHATMEEHF